MSARAATPREWPGIEDVHRLQAGDEDVGRVGEEVDRLLLGGRVLEGGRALPGEREEELLILGRIFPFRAPGHDQRARHRTQPHGRGQVPGQARPHLVAAMGVARVLLGHGGDDAAARSPRPPGPAPRPRAGARPSPTPRHRPRPASMTQPSPWVRAKSRARLASDRISSRAARHERLQHAVLVRLRGQARAHVDQRLQPPVHLRDALLQLAVRAGEPRPLRRVLDDRGPGGRCRGPSSPGSRTRGA